MNFRLLDYCSSITKITFSTVISKLHLLQSSPIIRKEWLCAFKRHNCSFLSLVNCISVPRSEVIAAF